MGHKEKREKKYDRVRDDQKKGLTKCNIEPRIEDSLIEVEEDLVEVPRTNRTFEKYVGGIF